MEIANRDLKLILIKEAIKDNNKFVIQKIIKLRNAQRENELLSVIYNDYKKYYDHMFNEKIREKAQLLFLSKYLEKSIKNIGLTDSEICKVKHSQKNILHNLDRVRSDLEDFVDRNN